MKLSFKEILKRISGVSTPVFGISWNPPRDERDIVSALITYFEDRRVLYDLRIVNHSIIAHGIADYPYVRESIFEIRWRLGSDLEKLDRSSDLFRTLSTMRAACRDFIDENSKPLKDLEGENRFQMSLGKLRWLFGQHIARLCVQYGIDLEEDKLVRILPHDKPVNQSSDAGTTHDT